MALVASRIDNDEALENQLRTIVADLSGDLREKMSQSASGSADHVHFPDLTEEDAERIMLLAVQKTMKV